MFHFVVFYVYI